MAGALRAANRSFRYCRADADVPSLEYLWSDGTLIPICRAISGITIARVTEASVDSLLESQHHYAQRSTFDCAARAFAQRGTITGSITLVDDNAGPYGLTHHLIGKGSPSPVKRADDSQSICSPVVGRSGAVLGPFDLLISKRDVKVEPVRVRTCVK